MDFSYSQQQLEIKRGIREWGKKHLTEEAIAAGYKTVSYTHLAPRS